MTQTAPTVADLLRREDSGTRQLRCAWCTLGSAFAAEILARSGADVVCIDVEHGLLGWDGALPSVVTLSAGRVPVLVRVPAGDPLAIMKALDAGAGGVIVPHIETAADAAAAVSSCRYPPAGHRSWGPTRASLFHDGDTFATNGAVVCIAMVETRDAIERCAEIAATPGLDAVIVGSNDLALDLLEDGGSVAAIKESADFEGLLESAAAACRSAGILAGAPILPSIGAARLGELGFGLVVGASDVALLREAAQREFAGAGNGASSTTLTVGY